MKSQEQYEKALETRNFEISLFWQRSNYFLVLNTALAAGFFFKNDQHLILAGLAVFGLITAWLWFQVTLGGRFWQVRWEEKLRSLEEEIGEKIGLFHEDSDKSDKDLVRESLERNPNRNCFRRWIDEKVIKKPSVSYSMIILSIVFIVFWSLLLLYSLFGFWQELRCLPER